MPASTGAMTAQQYSAQLSAIGDQVKQYGYNGPAFSGTGAPEGFFEGKYNSGTPGTVGWGGEAAEKATNEYHYGGLGGDGAKIPGVSFTGGGGRSGGGGYAGSGGGGAPSGGGSGYSFNNSITNNYSTQPTPASSSPNPGPAISGFAQAAGLPEPMMGPGFASSGTPGNLNPRLGTRSSTQRQSLTASGVRY